MIGSEVRIAGRSARGTRVWNDEGVELEDDRWMFRAIDPGDEILARLQFAHRQCDWRLAQEPHLHNPSFTCEILNECLIVNL
jgi:hypothetical protein